MFDKEILKKLWIKSDKLDRGLNPQNLSYTLNVLKGLTPRRYWKSVVMPRLSINRITYRSGLFHVNGKDKRSPLEAVGFALDGISADFHRTYYTHCEAEALDPEQADILIAKLKHRKAKLVKETKPEALKAVHGMTVGNFYWDSLVDHEAKNIASMPHIDRDSFVDVFIGCLVGDLKDIESNYKEITTA